MVDRLMDCQGAFASGERSIHRGKMISMQPSEKEKLLVVSWKIHFSDGQVFWNARESPEAVRPHLARRF
jgi:hypothetical protein